MIVTLVLNVEFGSFLVVCHEGVNAGEVVGIKVVSVLLGFYGVIELWQIIIGDCLVECL